MFRDLKCSDFSDCVECTARHCPNLEPVDPDDNESLYAEFYKAMHEEPSEEELAKMMEEDDY